MNRFLIVFAAMAAASVAQPAPPAPPAGIKTSVVQWWKQRFTIEQIHLTPDQQKKIDDVFQQFRVKLIDSTAALDHEEAIMDQLMMADPPDSAKVRPQIDRVAQARAELEKINANMLLGMRLLLSKEQWENLGGLARAGRGPLPRKVR
jgi:periplasmic protein CpxP/Spy